MDISGLIDLAVNLLTHSQFNIEVLLGGGSFVPNVFRGFGFGPDKVKEPAPVDYVGAAKATSQGNLELAQQNAEANKALVEAQTKANRINQYTPYGSLEYTYGKKFDQAGYDAALKKQQEEDARRQEFDRKVASGEWKRAGGGFLGSRVVDAQGNTQIRPFSSPPVHRSNFESGEPIWQQTMKLTPEAQATLDAQMAMDKQYADIAQIGLGKARKLLEDPNLDFSKLPELQGLDLSTLPQAPINAGQTAQQAIMSRLQPTLQQRENELAQRLANQGITLGSEAYQREMNLAGQNRNDLELQAAREGITLDQAARMNALNEQNLRYGNQADMRGRLLQEQAMQKDRPLNLINALRSGAQVQNPTFQPYAMQQGVQQANVAGPDYVKAGMLGYQQGMDSYNAQQARQQQSLSTAMKIGQMFFGDGGGGGASAAAARGMFGG